MRTEKDSLGEKTIPDGAYYGIHTVRSMENFGAGGEPVPSEVIYGIVRLKWACALANVKLGQLDESKGEAIVKACKRVLNGELDNQFPIDVFQSGSGTSTNMNVNEVLANVANEALGGNKGDRAGVHPNDEVNQGQSTNNVFPSAIKLAAVDLSDTVLTGLDKLTASFRVKGREFSTLLKSGRTHFRDAVPITLGQEFNAYAAALEKDAARIRVARVKLHRLGIGGNAVGTGVNTKKSFRAFIIQELGTITGLPYEPAEDAIEATQFLTDIAEMSSALRLTALDLHKICNDLRLLSSGPNTGLGEINLPPVEPGSSIMPGKVNPSICEAANMACIQVMGNDQVVSMACGAGQMELNTHMPLIALNLVKSLRILAHTTGMLSEKCVDGITANREVCLRHFEMSAGLATVLNPKLGYDRVAELVKEAVRDGKSLRQIVLEKKILSEQELEDILTRSTEPNL